jgi:hypothetical protein
MRPAAVLALSAVILATGAALKPEEPKRYLVSLGVGGWAYMTHPPSAWTRAENLPDIGAPTPAVLKVVTTPRPAHCPPSGDNAFWGPAINIPGC